jgi:hypothetical protein
MLKATNSCVLAVGLIVVAAAVSACSQSAGSVLPDMPSLPTQSGALSAEQQKKAIDDLLARRGQQEAEAQQQAKTER